MKKALFFWLSLLLASDELLAQTPLITYGSSWKYLDNGTDQGITWRSSSFNDGSWKTGNGLFGYGISGLSTVVSYGPDPKKKYITTYFRKTISLTDFSNVTSFSAGVLRDDGIVVYVNGVEVYRNLMPTGSINYLTFGKDASDNGTVTQSFTINKSAFVSGNNVIAVEIHQKTANNADLAFDLQLSVVQDQTAPTAVSILRQSPTTQLTNASTVIFRTNFSEKVTGVDNTDFTLTTVSGTAGGVLANGAVAPVGTGGTTYDVTVTGVQGDGTLRLDLKGSGTGITDTAGNAISTGFTNGDTYVLDHTPPFVASILRQSPLTQTTSDSTIKFRINFSEKVTGVDKNDFTLTTVAGVANGVLRDTAVVPVGTNGVAYDVTVNAVQGNGTLRLDLNNGGPGIYDAVGNAINSGFTNGETYIIQQQAPPDPPPAVTSINRQSPATQITNASTVIFRTTFSEKVRGVDHSDFTLTTVSGTASGVLANGAVSPVGTDSIAYDVTVTGVQGDGTLRLDLNGSGTGITDTAGNAISTGFINGETYIIQQQAPDPPPTVTSINRQSPATQITNASTVIFRTTFSEKVRGVDHSDFTLTTVSGTASGVLATGAVAPVGTDSMAYDVMVTSVQGDGTLRLDLKASGTGITDTAGNAISTGFTNGDTYVLDHTPPFVASILRQSPLTQTTSDSTIKFRINFSEKVTGVDKNDFTLTTVAGVANGVLRDTAVVPVGTNGVAYDVTVNAVQGNGTLRLDLNNGGPGIYDAVGNAINSGFTNGETYIIQQQAPEGPPTVTSINRQLPTNQQTDTTAITFRVIFSEKVRGVDAADFIIFTQSGNARGTLTKVAQQAVSSSLLDAVKIVGTDSTTYDVTIRAIAGSGVLRLDVKGNNTGITDVVGNALTGGFTNGQTYTVNTSLSQGFQSFVDLDPLSITSTTREIPQTKVWQYAGKWWAVAATSAGTKIFRLDNTSWTDVLTIATANNSRSDCKVVGNLVHLVLFRGASSTSYFVSLEYDPALNTYKRWTQRTSTINIVFEAGAVTATLDIDATGRMWIASNNNGSMLVRWSDAPYATWSAPITIASGGIGEDICAITTLPGKIGVLWSNQNTKRFGFKTHTNGADPTVWSTDEVPAGQSALNEGSGMADDHLNIVAASDGTLYCAVKTGYDKAGFPAMALLVRRPNNTWDNLYPVTSSKEGNRPIVVLNEAAGKVKVMYSTHIINLDGTRSGDILYRESSITAISFGPPVTLMSGAGNYNLEYTTSARQTYNPAIVVWATNESVSPLKAVGVLATDAAAAGTLARLSTTPTLMEADNNKGKWLVYPNPFANSTNINFTLPSSGKYSVILYDNTGRRIRVLRHGWAEAGLRNIVPIDGSHLAAGVYYIKVQAGEQIQTLKLFKR